MQTENELLTKGGSNLEDTVFNIDIQNHYPEQIIRISCLLFLGGKFKFLLIIVIWNVYVGDVKILQYLLTPLY